MRGDRKKEIERCQLLDFQGLCVDAPRGRIEDSERPDFLIHTCDGIVGVEITRLLDRGAIPASEEGAWNKILSNAQTKYERQTGILLSVGVTFQRQINTRGGRTEEMADQLCRSVRRVAESMAQQCKRHIVITGEQCGLPFVEKIEIADPELSEEGSWYATGWIEEPVLIDAILQAVVNEKSKEVKTIYNKCRLCWLLIIETGDYSASFDTFQEGIPRDPLESPFERTYLYRLPKGMVIRLQTTPMSQF